MKIPGVPAGASLSAGTKNSDGSWTLIPKQLAGLTMTPAKGDGANWTLTVTATGRDSGSTSTQKFQVLAAGHKYGGAGKDGFETLSYGYAHGGAGDDVFNSVRYGSTGYGNEGADTFKSVPHGEQGNDVLIEAAGTGDDIVTLHGTQLSQLSDSDFIFS